VALHAKTRNLTGWRRIDARTQESRVARSIRCCCFVETVLLCSRVLRCDLSSVSPFVYSAAVIKAEMSTWLFSLFGKHHRVTLIPRSVAQPSRNPGSFENILPRVRSSSSFAESILGKAARSPSCSSLEIPGERDMRKKRCESRNVRGDGFRSKQIAVYI